MREARSSLEHIRIKCAINQTPEDFMLSLVSQNNIVLIIYEDLF